MSTFRPLPRGKTEIEFQTVENLTGKQITFLRDDLCLNMSLVRHFLHFSLYLTLQGRWIYPAVVALQGRRGWKHFPATPVKCRKTPRVRTAVASR